jgi:hypothetical protein
MIRTLGGALLFAVLVLAVFRLGVWFMRALADYAPHCVYEYDLDDGRVYVGHAQDPIVRGKWHRAKQRVLPDGHPRKWWHLLPPDVQESCTPPRWTWYRSKDVAEHVEKKRIRHYEEAGRVTANRIKYRGKEIVSE